MSKGFKVGQILRVSSACTSAVREKILADGGNPYRLEVRSLDRDGDPIFTYEDSDEINGFAKSEKQFEVLAPANFHVFVLPGTQRMATRPVRCATLEEAKAWIVENGKTGERYRIQELINHGSFKVASTTVNTLEAA